MPLFVPALMQGNCSSAGILADAYGNRATGTAEADLSIHRHNAVGTHWGIVYGKCAVIRSPRETKCHVMPDSLAWLRLSLPLAVMTFSTGHPFGEQ